MAMNRLRALPPWSMWLAIVIVLLTMFVARELLLGPRSSGPQPNPYPEQAVDNFLRTCTEAGNSGDSCACAIGQIQRRFTYKQFQDLENGIAAGGERAEAATETITSVVAPCAAGP